MRLIDADELKQYAGTYDGTNAQVEAVEVKYIDKATTVERPKGEWINEHCVDIGYKTAECSCCGERSRLIIHDTGFGYEYEYYPFCHWCGADMRVKA